jgi:hypothetical protein
MFGRRQLRVGHSIGANGWIAAATFLHAAIDPGAAHAAELVLRIIDMGTIGTF